MDKERSCALTKNGNTLSYREAFVFFAVYRQSARERYKITAFVFARAVCVSIRSRVTTCVRERREEEACKGSPHFVSVGIGIISLCDDFFHERRFCDDAKPRANFDSNEYENQRKEHHLFYRKQREKRRKDEKRVVFFVFVTCTTTLFSRTKEGV